jgi:4'-phosphopantetheinyl transferase
MKCALLPDEVHVWYDVLAADEDEARAAAARRIVTPEEWARCQRFVYAEGRRESLAARRLVRSVLSLYAAVHPSDWRFRNSEHGRPEVDGPAGASAPRFNLSHAHGVVACAVSAQYAVGVDVEPLHRMTPDAIADTHFAPSEVAALRALPEPEQPRRFLEYWTLKEAYLKARGAGLSVPLNQFAFDIAPPGRPRVTFEPGFGDDNRHWQFDHVLIGATHLVAVATQRGTAPDVRVIVRAFDNVQHHADPPG